MMPWIYNHMKKRVEIMSKLVPGTNDLTTLHPELLEEWDYQRNKNITPDDVTEGSHQKVWWLCKNKHSWLAAIKDRVRGNGCPYCSNRKILVGYNDLATTAPELALEWNYEKNGELTPYNIHCGSSKRVWWKCENGHEWQAPVVRRSQKIGCPYCAGKKSTKGVNDLATIRPDLIKEWNYEKNDKIKPEDCMQYSNKSVWWKCSKGHEWKTKISARSKGTGCPFCSNAQTSLPEYAIYYYAKMFFAAENRSKPFDWELDIFLRDYKIGIEYDGQAWHNNIDSLKREYLKNESCQKHGIQLIRVKESDINQVDGSVIYYKYNDSYKEFNFALRKLFEYLSCVTGVAVDIDSIDFIRDELKINSEYRYSLENPKNSIADNKALVEEWNYEKNGILNPGMFTESSHQKVWWKCKKCGGEWHTSIVKRVTGRNCPYCSHKKIMPGLNDIETEKPELQEEWDFDKNSGIDPKCLSAGSHKKVWWKCKKCGGAWNAMVYQRATGVGCPYCSNKMILIGKNDLASTHPYLAEEWNYEKNGTLKPVDVVVGSNKKVWWKCKKCGGEWRTAVEHRKEGKGCPYCAGQKVLRGYNDLESKRPDLLEEWDYEKNIEIQPYTITEKSGKKVWWKCQSGHSWLATAHDRGRGTGCPFCRKK